MALSIRCRQYLMGWVLAVMLGSYSLCRCGGTVHIERRDFLCDRSRRWWLFVAFFFVDEQKHPHPIHRFELGRFI